MIDKIKHIRSLFAETLSDPFTYDIHVNGKGVATAWCTLSSPRQLLPAAALIKQAGSRLSTITAYQHTRPQPSDVHEIAYHFDLDGDTLTLTVHLPAGERDIPSLTPLFRNANWNEREFMELYDLNVVGHPNPTRLFLDDDIDPAVLQKFIPFSEMVNAASTKSLWEKIMSQRGEKK